MDEEEIQKLKAKINSICETIREKDLTPAALMSLISKIPSGEEFDKKIARRQAHGRSSAA